MTCGPRGLQAKGAGSFSAAAAAAFRSAAGPALNGGGSGPGHLQAQHGGKPPCPHFGVGPQVAEAGVDAHSACQRHHRNQRVAAGSVEKQAGGRALGGGGARSPPAAASEVVGGGPWGAPTLAPASSRASASNPRSHFGLHPAPPSPCHWKGFCWRPRPRGSDQKLAREVLEQLKGAEHAEGAQGVLQAAKSPSLMRGGCHMTPAVLPAPRSPFRDILQLIGAVGRRGRLFPRTKNPSPGENGRCRRGHGQAVQPARAGGADDAPEPAPRLFGRRSQAPRPKAAVRGPAEHAAAS